MNFLNRFKYARDSYLITILIVAIVMMLNFIASRHFLRVDLTQNQIYAISDASKSIMRHLDDIVTVKVYFSEKLPPNLFDVQQYTDDILEELSSYSQGNLAVDFLSPTDPQIANQALQYGIPQIRMNIVEKDKLEVKNGFLGIAVIYGDRVEVLPVIQNTRDIEYDLIASIKKVTALKPRTVGFVTGHNEPDLTKEVALGQLASFSLLKGALDRNYEVVTIDLSEENSLEEVDTLLLAGSKTSFSDEEKYAIDQFLLNGGSIIAFLDSIEVGDNLQTSFSTLDLNELFKNYGVEIEEKFVLDVSNETATFNQGSSFFISPYSFWVKVVNMNFNQENPIVSKLDSFILPWVSPIKLSEKEGVASTVLAKTTENAWVQESPFNLDPGLVHEVSQKDQFPLAVLLKGEFASFFTEDDAPVDGDHLDASIEPGRLFLVGNSRFAMDRFVQQFPQNLLFTMNAIDYLTLDESLISIRSKASIDLPLKDLAAQQRQLVKMIGILLMPVLVVAFGIVRFVYRKKKKYSLS